MRIGEGGGDPVTGNTYAIKTMAVTPDSASGYSASQIEQLFEGLDPTAVAQAGGAHTAASQTLARIAAGLVQHVQVLNDSWSGSAAQAAVGSFQQLHQTAIGLAQASAQTGAVLSWLGETILPYYKNYKAPGNGIVGDVESLFGHNPQNSAAQAVMERLNNRLVQANTGLPDSVSQDLPKGGWLGGHANTTSGGPGSGGAGSGLPAGGGAVGGSGGAPNLGGAGGVGGGSVARIGGSGAGLRGVSPGTGTGVGGGVGASGGVGRLGGLSGGSPGTRLAGIGTPGGPGSGGVGPGAGLGSAGGPGSGGAGVPGGGIGGASGAGGPGGSGLGVGPGVPGLPGGGAAGAAGGEEGAGGTEVGFGGVGAGESGAGGAEGGAGFGGVGESAGGGPGAVGAEGGAAGAEGSAGGAEGGVGLAGLGSSPGGAGGTGAEGGGMGEGFGRSLASAPGGESLVDEGDGAVLGPDGMISAAPGPGADGMRGSLGGSAGTGDSAAADGELADAAAGRGGTGLPMLGSSAAGQRETERRRQAWMAEEDDVWAAEPEVVEPLIGA